MQIQFFLGPYVLLNFLSWFSSAFLAIGLLKWKNAKPVHHYFAYLLLAVGTALPLASLWDGTEISVFCGLSWLLLALSPLFLSLSIEKTTGSKIPLAERFILLLGAVAFSIGGFCGGFLSVVWVVAFALFHGVIVFTNIFRLFRTSYLETNPQQKIVFRALACTLILCLLFLGIDWAARLSGSAFRPFSVTTLLFIYCLTRIVFSGNLKSLRREFGKILTLIALSALIYTVGLWLNSGSLSRFSLNHLTVFFGFFLAIFAVFNQVFPKSSMLAFREREIFSAKYRSVEDFLRAVARIPEMQGFCLIEPSYLRQMDCAGVAELFDGRKEVWSWDLAFRFQRHEQDFDRRDRLMQLTYLMKTTGSEFVACIPESDYFIGFSFMPLVNSRVYGDFIRTCAYKIGLILKTSPVRAEGTP